MYKKHALFDKIRICGIHQKTKLFYFSWRRVDHFMFISTLWFFGIMYKKQATS